MQVVAEDGFGFSRKLKEESQVSILLSDSVYVHFLGFHTSLYDMNVRHEDTVWCLRAKYRNWLFWEASLSHGMGTFLNFGNSKYHAQPLEDYKQFAYE